jgi:hypothetical protein
VANNNNVYSMRGDSMFKVNDKKTPIPQKTPVKKDDRSTPFRDSRHGTFDRNPQQNPKPNPNPKPDKK